MAVETHYNPGNGMMVMDHRTLSNGRDTDMSMRLVNTGRSFVSFCFAIFLLANLPSVRSSQSDATDPAPPPPQAADAGSESDSNENVPGDDKNRPSDAERIGEIQESLEDDQKQLLRLEQEIDNPDSEYAIAEKEFRAIKDDLEKTNEQLEAARKSEDEVLVQHLEQELASLQTQRKLAEDRFDLAIEDRKTLREQKVTLKRKIENDKAALAAITGEDLQQRADDAAKSAESNSHRDASNGHPSRSKEQGDRDEDSSSDANGKSSSSESANESHDGTDSDEKNEELTKAVEEAEEKEKEADEAQEETQSIAARLADIQKLVAQEQKELDLARKKVELASAAQLTLSQELTRRSAEDADAAELAELRTAIGNASNRLIKARSEVSEISERLNDHRAEQSSLQSEHIVALHEAEKKRQEANLAEDRIADIRNPFTLRNMLQWSVEHGPRILAIIIGMFLLNHVASFFASRSVRLVTSGSGRGSKMEKENRAKTLVGVFQNASTVAIFITGAMMVLEEVGANITVLMGGVAVIGLAVAFGAQNLIKDYFYGFVMLLENQYMLNDTVRVGGVSGQVERITLRMTVLRDSNGVVHFIPNGTINSVSNETHGWSRAVCEIAVGYHESLDRITDILSTVGKELQADSDYGRLLLEAPTAPAIECLGEHAIDLKMSVKTLPNKHGTVKQEWLKRITTRFEELGVQHPFPQRIIHVQTQEKIVSEHTQPLGTLRTGTYRQAG